MPLESELKEAERRQSVKWRALLRVAVELRERIKEADLVDAYRSYAEEMGEWVDTAVEQKGE